MADNTYRLAASDDPDDVETPLTRMASATGTSTEMSAERPRKSQDDGPHLQRERLISLDAFRGFVMLAMASDGFGVAKALQKHPEILEARSGAAGESVWVWMWQTLEYQFGHVAWTGCAFWDLIQPSFMFLVGVSMPFSFSNREARGRSMLRHTIKRAVVLVLLGVFLQSQRPPSVNFIFTNVLAQIGLGYVFLYLFWDRAAITKIVAAVAIVIGYGAWFVIGAPPAEEVQPVEQYLTDVKQLEPAEWKQFSGFTAHWNKHTNAAAAADRVLLNRFPRSEEEWNGRKYWINPGGYQTLNFVPSIATMLLGLVAGGWLAGGGPAREKLYRLLLAGTVCFAVAMAVDTTIWPVRIPGFDWSLCPAVKRIWSPTWAVFSAGWTFWMLGGFYFVCDMTGFRRLVWPLTIVGMNSIAMYCMAQLLKPWISRMLEIGLNTIDLQWRTQTANMLFSPDAPYAAILESIARVFVLWLICVWMYQRKLFVRV